MHHLIKLIIERESENKVQKSVKTENVFVAIWRKDLMEEFTPENVSHSLYLYLKIEINDKSIAW